MPELSLAQHKVQYILKGFPALYKQRQAQPFYTFDNSFYNFLFAAILFYLQRFFFICSDSFLFAAILFYLQRFFFICSDSFLFAVILFYLQRFFFIAAILFCLPNLPKLTTFNFGHCFVCENCVSSLGEITCSHNICKKMVSRTIDKDFPMYFQIFFLKKTTVSGIRPNNRNYHLLIEIIKLSFS